MCGGVGRDVLKCPCVCGRRICMEGVYTMKWSQRQAEDESERCSGLVS